MSETGRLEPIAPEPPVSGDKDGKEVKYASQDSGADEKKTLCDPLKPNTETNDCKEEASSLRKNKKDDILKEKSGDDKDEDLSRQEALLQQMEDQNKEHERIIAEERALLKELKQHTNSNIPAVADPRAGLKVLQQPLVLQKQKDNGKQLTAAKPEDSNKQAGHKGKDSGEQHPQVEQGRSSSQPISPEQNVQQPVQIAGQNAAQQAVPVAQQQPVQSGLLVQQPIQGGQVVQQPIAAAQVVQQPIAAAQIVQQPIAAAQVVQQPIAVGQVVQQPVAAGQFVQQPVITGQLVQQPAQVVQQQAQVVQQPVQVMQQPAQVVQQPVEVMQQPAQVVQQPAQVVQQPAQVAQQPAQVVQQPAQVAQQLAQVVQQPVQVGQVVQQSVQPVQMAQQPVQPVQVAQQPVQPVQAAQQPPQTVQIVQQMAQAVQQQAAQIVQKEPLQILQQQPLQVDQVVNQKQVPAVSLVQVQQPLGNVETIPQNPLSIGQLDKQSVNEDIVADRSLEEEGKDKEPQLPNPNDLSKKSNTHIQKQELVQKGDVKGKFMKNDSLVDAENSKLDKKRLRVTNDKQKNIAVKSNRGEKLKTGKNINDGKEENALEDAERTGIKHDEERRKRRDTEQVLLSMPEIKLSMPDTFPESNLPANSDDKQVLKDQQKALKKALPLEFEAYDTRQLLWISRRKKRRRHQDPEYNDEM